MKFISTRGQCRPHSLLEVVMTGLAPDGGLFVPEHYPQVSSAFPHWQELSFGALFEQVWEAFEPKSIPSSQLRELIARSFSGFSAAEVIPVRPLAGCHLVELFHGPSFAFKDVALQVLGNVFERELARRGGSLTVLGATSGDTGSAAIQALRGKAGVEVFVLFPAGRVSPMQERQMTTVADANIHCIALEGSFDDAQRIVKELFNDHAFHAKSSLAAINSINWLRIMAQVVYYFYAYFQVVRAGGCALGAPVRIAVPTGNFGNVFAGYVAGRMRLPLDKLIIATNVNDILHAFVSSGVYAKGAVQATFSPSMDIQVASNFERYLFELCGGDAAQLRSWMEILTQQGQLRLQGSELAIVQADFASARADDAETLETIAAIYQQEGYLLDPHSAVGMRAALAHRQQDIPMICMGTAHPAKFSQAICQAIGKAPPLPAELAELAQKPARVKQLPADRKAVQSYMREVLAL